MKSIFITLTLAFTLFSCKSSDKKSEKTTTTSNDQVAIRGLMDNYREMFKKSDWDGLLELIHPGAFTVIPKAEFKKALESSFKGDGYEIQFKGMSVDSITPVIENKGDKY